MKKYSLVILLVLTCTIAMAQKEMVCFGKHPASPPPGTVVDIARVNTDDYFHIQEIPDEVFRRMQGKSFPKNCTTKRSDLRYLRVLHRNFRDETQVGEMVCHKSIAKELMYLFSTLYQIHYRIERMVLIDDYDADDERSMAANNTSCFNFRFMTGSKTKISMHGKGLAIDINPLYNPYVSRSGRIAPAKGKPYTVRTRGRHKALDDIIIRNDQKDRLYHIMKTRGYAWGGDWKHPKDYQHFEKVR